MKIIFATPIYPPDIGGPAIYAKNLKEGLEREGNSTKIISYRGLRKIPQPLRIFLYFLKLFKITRNCDLIYAFNSVSCGLPAYFCKRKLAIRIGGDYLWERAVESGKTQKSLREYYKELPADFKVNMIKKVLKKADRLIFTSQFQRDVYIEHFGIEEEKTTIIPNPFPEIKIPNYGLPVANCQLLYAGRFIKLKNLDRLIEAFGKVAGNSGGFPTLKIIGEGPELNNLKLQIANLKLEDRVTITEPISHEDMLKEIQKSYLCVLPSLTEITPNFALECIKLQKPILLTRETGLYEAFKDDLIFINPFSVEDIRDKIEFLLNKDNLNNYAQKISRIDTKRSWENIIEDHIRLFKNYDD